MTHHQFQAPPDAPGTIAEAPVRRRRFGMGAAALAVVAAGVLVGIVAAVILLGSREPNVATAPSATASVVASGPPSTPTAAPATPEPVQSPTATPVPATPDPTPTARPRAEELSWTVEPFTGGGTPSLRSIQQIDGRWFVAGSVGDSAERVAAAIWVSEDGEAWTPAAVDSAAEQAEGLNSFVTDIVAADGSLVAHGVASVPSTDSGRPLLWRSTDGGLSWSQIAPPPDDLVWLRDVVAGGPGIVAVTSCCFDGSTRYSEVWTSVDGESWTQVGRFDFSEMRSVTVAPSGRLVAVGSRWQDADTRDLYPGVWTSTDGVEWSAVGDIGAAPFDQLGTATAVAAGSDGFAAVGIAPEDAESARGPQAWFSADGLTWQRADIAGDWHPDDLAHGDAGFVAVGGPTSADPQTYGWGSSTGTAWAFYGPLGTNIGFNGGIASRGREYLAIAAECQGPQACPGNWVLIRGAPTE